MRFTPRASFTSKYASTIDLIDISRRFEYCFFILFSIELAEKPSAFSAKVVLAEKIPPELDRRRVQQRRFFSITAEGFDKPGDDCAGPREQLRRSSVKRIYAGGLRRGWRDSTLQSSTTRIQLSNVTFESARARTWAFV